VTYLLAFGENYLHFHAVIAPRGDDVPPERRSGGILKLIPDHVVPVAAGRLVPLVRDVYRRMASIPAAAMRAE
jgi:hypothetical protein